MRTTLRNGEEIDLQWNPIVLEYLEDYEGGIKQLKKDIGTGKNQFQIFNFVIYCMMNASYSKELSYTEAVSLIDVNELEKIADFIIDNINNMNQENRPSLIDNVTRKHRR